MEGDIQQVKFIQMGDGLDVVDEKDGVKDGSQVSASCEVVAGDALHRARQPCKRTRHGKSSGSGLGHTKFEVPLGIHMQCQLCSPELTEKTRLEIQVLDSLMSSFRELLSQNYISRHSCTKKRKERGL